MAAQGGTFALRVDRPGWLAVSVDAVGLDGVSRSVWIEARRGSCDAVAESALGNGLIWVDGAETVFLRAGLVSAKHAGEPTDFRLTSELFPALIGRISGRTGDGSGDGGGDGGDGNGDGGDDTEEEDDEVLPLMSPENCPDPKAPAAGSWKALFGRSPAAIGRIAGATGDGGSGDGGNGDGGTGDGGDGGDDTEEEDDEVLPLVAPPVKCPAAVSLGIDCRDSDDFSFCARGLGFGRMAKGSFEAAEGVDRDFYRFSLDAARTVGLHAVGVARSSLLDAFGRSLIEAEGGPGEDGISLAATLPRGEYFLRVEGEEGSTGGYRVMLRTAAHR